MIKGKRKAVTVEGKRKVVRKKPAVKKSGRASKKDYDIHTGRPMGREISAMQRLEKLTEKYVAEGMSLAEARSKAKAEMRANPRMDWRAWGSGLTLFLLLSELAQFIQYPF